MSSTKMKHDYIRSLLDDLEALDLMISQGWIENDCVRLGAEQEMVLVDLHARPYPIAEQIMEKCRDVPWLTPELSKFNLEINLDPLKLTGDCFSEMEQQLSTRLDYLSEQLDGMPADLVLCGILPSMRKNDLDLKNLSPYPRYHSLMSSLKAELSDQPFALRLSGIDELNVNHESALLEACNTSFQVHLQVDDQSFLSSYVASQILTAPLIALAANSPIVFGRRLWHESRIAMFQQSIDTRKIHTHMRERSPRVMFGDGWNYSSITDIYKEDISRFKILFTDSFDLNSVEKVRNGEYPDLKALKLFNSTVYRWNRPCFGFGDGKAHLRIENRVLPAGPSVIDEVANTAFWIGSVIGLRESSKDLRNEFRFVDVRDNFAKAARYGLDSFFTWRKNQKMGVKELFTKELLPLAREGLKRMNIDTADQEKYLGVVEERIDRHMNGARWSLIFYTDLLSNMNRYEAQYQLTRQMVKNQKENLPVHEWEMPQDQDLPKFDFKTMKVDEFMTTEVITVSSSDLLELAAEILVWKKVDYILVEDDDGKIAGILDEKLIIQSLLQNKAKGDSPVLVSEVMRTDFIVVQPEDSIKKAYDLMTDSDISCLAVCDTKEEVSGIISKHNFYYLAGRLLSL